MKQRLSALPLMLLAGPALAHGGHAAAPEGMHTLLHVLLVAGPAMAMLTLVVWTLGITRWRKEGCTEPQDRRAP